MSKPSRRLSARHRLPRPLEAELMLCGGVTISGWIVDEQDDGVGMAFGGPDVERVEAHRPCCVASPADLWLADEQGRGRPVPVRLAHVTRTKNVEARSGVLHFKVEIHGAAAALARLGTERIILRAVLARAQDLARRRERKLLQMPAADRSFKGPVEEDEHLGADFTRSRAFDADDGHELDAFVARPEAASGGAVIVLQEIFGITDHIKAMAGKFAAAGYLAVAPAMFDRAGRGLVLSYSDFAAARAAMSQLDRAQCVLDMKAAADYARTAGKVASVGFCWGGSMADLAACHGLVSSSV